MAKVTDITAQKRNTDRYNLFINDEFYCGISVDTVAKYYLYKNKEITDQVLEAIALNEFRQYFLRRSMDYATRGYKTEKGIRDYVKRLLFKKDILNEYFGEEIVKQIDKDSLTEWVAHEIKELHLIDDIDYAKEFASERVMSRPRGKRMIEYELMQKGVNKEDIKAALENVDIDEKTMIADLLQKKYRKTKLKYDDQKEINFLRGKGFDWDEISKFIES